MQSLEILPGAEPGLPVVGVQGGSLPRGACAICRLYAGKEQTQGLDARTLFHKRDGRIEPGLQPLEVSVRAVVAPLGDAQASARLASAVREHIVPVAAEAGVWLQDPKKYHSTLFHASSHAVRC